MNDATFTIGAETSDARVVAVQMQSRSTRGATARDVAGQRAVTMYLSSDADGAVPEAGALTVADGGAGALLPITAEALGAVFLTDEDGLVEVEVSTDTDAADTVYLNVIAPATGKVLTSGVLTFIDNP